MSRTIVLFLFPLVSLVFLPRTSRPDNPGLVRPPPDGQPPPCKGGCPGPVRGADSTRGVHGLIQTSEHKREP